MRILFLTDGIYPFQLGGMQRHSALLCEHFSNRGVVITMVHCGGVDYSVENFKEKFSSDLVEELLIPFHRTDSFPGHYVRESKKYSKEIYNSVKERLKLFDLIYAQGFTPWYFLKAKNSGVKVPPVFSNRHGLNLFQPAYSLKAKVENQLLKPISRYILTNSDFVFSFGGKLDNIFEKIGVDEKRVLHQRNGVLASSILDQPRQVGRKLRRFIFVGRNDKVKGFDLLLQAFLRLKVHHDIELSVVGPFEGFQNNEFEGIQFLGEIRDYNQLLIEMSKHDCLISTSYSEGLPLAILEAMSQGLAILGTDVGATASLIDGNGLLIKKPIIDEVLYSMKEALKWSENELDERKRKSITLAKTDYSWSNIITEKLQLLEKMISS